MPKSASGSAFRATEPISCSAAARTVCVHKPTSCIRSRMVDFGMELRMSERSEHYDIHTEFQVPRMVNRSCGRGCRPPTPDPWGSLRGLAPSCTRRRVPPSRRRGATLSRGEPTVLHCRRAPFSVGKRGVRYPFVPKAGRCRRRWVSSTQSFESRSARVPR